MAQSKKKWVAFKSNVTVPGDVVSEDKDQKMQVGEPVQLPAAYADHVVQDGFAAYCDAPKKAAPKRSAGKSSETKPDAGAGAKLEAAQARVLVAQKALYAAEGTDLAEGARGELLDAQKALGALQSAS